MITHFLLPRYMHTATPNQEAMTHPKGKSEKKVHNVRCGLSEPEILELHGALCAL